MDRIIDGYLYESKTLPLTWDVRTFEVAGHREVSIRQAVEWVEVGPERPYVREGDGYKGAPTAANLALWAKQDAADAEDRRLNSLKRSCSRSMTMCRRIIKAEGFNELLTLTYRANQRDRELCKKHFSIWQKRMKRALGEFRYCASFEEQKRGAMHVHIACHKLPEHAKHKGVKIKAWELGTRIWRDIVGLVEIEGPLQPGQDRQTLTGGLCFVGGKTKNGGEKRRKNMSIGKMASYVSKYISKDFQNAPEEKNRYSASNRKKDAWVFKEQHGPLQPGKGPLVVPVLVRAPMPHKQHLRFEQTSLADLIDAVFTLGDGDVIVSHRVGPWKDSYWLVTEPCPV